LYSCEQHELAPGARARIRTGIAIAVPEGCAGLVLPRSGLALKHGITLTNAPGLIDAGYRGELMVILHNTDLTKTFEVTAGDRIAQLMLVQFGHAEWTQVDSFEETVRGEGGFGSSGV
jgi:dUTP pyrophosphatase